MAENRGIPGRVDAALSYLYYMNSRRHPMERPFDAAPVTKKESEVEYTALELLRMYFQFETDCDSTISSEDDSEGDNKLATGAPG